MIVLLRFIIVVMSVVLMVFSLASKEDKEPKWKWQIIGAIALQVVYYALGIYNNSPYVLAQFFCVVIIWMFALMNEKEHMIYVVVAVISVVAVIITGIWGMSVYDENIKIVEKEISKEVRTLSATEDFLYPEDGYYNFFVRSEDGSVKSKRVAKENVTIYDNLPEGAEPYVEEKEVLEQRWNHNRHTPTVEWEGEKTVYVIYLPKGSIAVV